MNKEDIIIQCVALCSHFKCSIQAALDDLAWPTNGLRLTEEEEFSVRQQVKAELRELRRLGA
jgi:hypothetical protein